jgi:hypothetical protein
MNDSQPFETITKQTIQKLRINSHYPLTWGILLEGGEIIFGNLQPTTVSPAGWQKPTKKFGSLTKEEIDNSLTFYLPYKGIYVPLSTIKSIFGLYSSFPFYGVTNVEGELIDWSSIEEVLREKYNIFVSLEVGYKVDTWKELDQAQKIAFHGPTILYSDWEWFRSISGGINSIGVGILTGSGNIGWSKSLHKVFWDKIGSSPKTTSEEAVIKGRVKVLHKMIEIEGENWLELKVSSKKHLIALCKRRNFLFPIKRFNKIASSLTLYGDVSRFTGDSKKLTIFRVRGIAFKQPHDSWMSGIFRILKP